MSESSSSVPDEIADAEIPGSAAPESADSMSSTQGSDIEERSTEGTPSTVDLDIDQDKLDAWDAVKGDYQVGPDDESVPDSMDQGDPDLNDSPEAGTDATQS